MTTYPEIHTLFPATYPSYYTAWQHVREFNRWYKMGNYAFAKIRDPFFAPHEKLITTTWKADLPTPTDYDYAKENLHG